MKIIRQSPHFEAEIMDTFSSLQANTRQSDDPGRIRTDALRIKSASGTRVEGFAQRSDTAAISEPDTTIRYGSEALSRHASAKIPSTPKPLDIGGAWTWGGRR